MCIELTLYLVDWLLLNYILLHPQVTEAYADFSNAESPMVCSMGISCEVPLVNSGLGMVHAGSPITYQQPAAAQRDMSFHVSPPCPSLPLEGYHLEPSVHMSETTEAEHRHLQSLHVTWDMANTLESTTRSQSCCEEWHQLRRPRPTPHVSGKFALLAANVRTVWLIGSWREHIRQRPWEENWSWRLMPYGSTHK